MGLYAGLSEQVMNHYIRSNNPGLRFLLAYWKKYCQLEPWHTDWARRYIRIQNGIRRGQTLYLEGDHQKKVYFVTQGMLARVRYNDKGKRQLLSVALPGMALMCTDHLYSHTPSKGDIVVLRPRTVVVDIPYRAIVAFNEQEPQLNTLLHILTNKKKKQMTTLSRILHETDPFARHLLFVHDMPDLQALLTQVEQAELLCISRKTVQRSQYYLLTGRKSQN